MRALDGFTVFLLIQAKGVRFAICVKRQGIAILLAYERVVSLFRHVLRVQCDVLCGNEIIIIWYAMQLLSVLNCNKAVRHICLLTLAHDSVVIMKIILNTFLRPLMLLRQEIRGGCLCQLDRLNIGANRISYSYSMWVWGKLSESKLSYWITLKATASGWRRVIPLNLGEHLYVAHTFVLPRLSRTVWSYPWLIWAINYCYLAPNFD